MLIFSSVEIYGSERVVTKRVLFILHHGSPKVGYYFPDSLKTIRNEFSVEDGGEGRMEVRAGWAWSKTSQVLQNCCPCGGQLSDFTFWLVFVC